MGDPNIHSEIAELRDTLESMRLQIGNGRQQSFKIPSVLLISAFVVSLLGLAGWALALERNKADRTEVTQVRVELRTISEDIKTLLRRP